MNMMLTEHKKIMKKFPDQQILLINGFPTGIRVYKSLKNGGFQLNNIFYGEPQGQYSSYQFILPEIIKCDQLKLEVVDLTSQTLVGNSKNLVINELYLMKRDLPEETVPPTAKNSPLESPSGIPNNSPSYSPMNSPSGSPVISPSISPERIPISDVCDRRSSCKFEGSGTNQVDFVVEMLNFSSIVNEGDGGAIYISNAGITCGGVSFNNCQSSEGGGGGIYIKNDIEILNEIHLNNVDFDKCKALFGGGVFIHCNTSQVNVLIFDCHFSSCQAASFSSSASASSKSSPYFGGGALFITSKRATINECQFIRNVGQSQLMIHNNFDQYKGEFLDDSFKGFNRIKYCKFEIDEHSECSLFYLGAVDGVFCNVKNSVFCGKTSCGNFHIDGLVSSKFTPKIIFEWCKFSSDSSKSFNVENGNNYLLAVSHKQTFNYNNDNGFNEKNILAYSVVVFTVFITVVVVVLFKKRAETANLGNDVI